MSEEYVKMMSVKHVPTISTLTIGENYSCVADPLKGPGSICR